MDKEGSTDDGEIEGEKESYEGEEAHGVGGGVPVMSDGAVDQGRSSFMCVDECGTVAVFGEKG